MDYNVVAKIEYLLNFAERDFETIAKGMKANNDFRRFLPVSVIKQKFIRWVGICGHFVGTIS